jgi:hypothetical protein
MTPAFRWRSSTASATPSAVSAGQRKRSPPSAAASGLARDELYERAKQADIPGRSTMTKQTLADALEETT